jgi:glyoxylase-like metal-dependent hydrolase (beta-lactamase superfamily II)
VKYLLNSHHHGDHASGNAYMRDALGVDIIAHKNIRANFLRIKQAGEPNLTFADQAAVYAGGVELQLFWWWPVLVICHAPFGRNSPPLSSPYCDGQR